MRFKQKQEEIVKYLAEQLNMSYLLNNGENK